MSQDEQNCQACGIGRICRLVKGHGGPHEWIASNPTSEYQRGYEAGLEAAAQSMCSYCADEAKMAEPETYIEGNCHRRKSGQYAKIFISSCKAAAIRALPRKGSNG